MKNTKLLLMFCAVSLVVSIAKSNDPKKEAAVSPGTSKALTILLNSKPSKDQIEQDYKKSSYFSRDDLYELANDEALLSPSKNTLIKDQEVQTRLQEKAEKITRSAINADKPITAKKVVEFMYELEIPMTGANKELAANYFTEKKEAIFAEGEKELIAKGETLKEELGWIQAIIELTKPKAKEGEEAGYVSDPEEYTQIGKILKKLGTRTAEKLKQEKQAQEKQEQEKAKKEAKQEKTK